VGGQGGVAGAGGAAETLEVRYRLETINETDPDIRLIIELVNRSGAEISLDDVTIRYWYTLDNAAQPTEEFVCDFSAGPSCMQPQQVAGAFFDAAAAGATRYLEVSFSGDITLANNVGTDEMKLRIHHPTGAFDENDDYSYDPTKAQQMLTPWRQVTAYDQQVLAWGDEPQ